MYYCLLLITHLIFESLPVSSSGHVNLFQRLMCRVSGGCPVLSTTLNALLHGPTSIIVAVFFRKRWLPMMLNIKRCRRLIARLMMLGVCAELPTLVWYFFFSRHPVRVENFPLWLGFGITALLLYSLRLCRTRQKTRIASRDACLIGFAQGMALLPGISRMGSTYVVGRWLGLTPRLSFCFSCTIEWPLITLAFLRGAYDVVRCAPLNIFGFGVGAVAGISACVLVASILSYYILGVVESLMIQNKIWRLSLYMLIPLTLSLIL